MSLATIIATSRSVLVRIVAMLVALLADHGSGAARVPLPVMKAILRVLHPAESAVRRLLVVAAKGLVVPAQAVRAMPAGLVIESKGGARTAFPLFDSRKHFPDPDEARRTGGPRIRSIDALSPREQFFAKFIQPHDGCCSLAEATRVNTRLLVLKRVLDHLPREARRMARWLQSRVLQEHAKFTSPLRPGPPPGHYKRRRLEIDEVLTRCHDLAWTALKANTS